MATHNRYRIEGDIIITNNPSKEKIRKGSKLEFSYGVGKRANFQQVAILQYQKRLTSKAPFFQVHILKCDPNATISIGIAPPQISGHTGLFNNSLGYQNNTGRIYTSWKANANTLGVPYGKGNEISIHVTHFGENLSTVLIFYDNFPIATRYHFERRKEYFLPTITFSGGPVDIAVVWPKATDSLPNVDEIPISHWIRGPTATYDHYTGVFENRSKLEDLPVQSPTPLSKSFRSFVVTQQEISSIDGKGASVGLATFSPLKPTPTCSLMKDYYTWFSKTKMKPGNSIGWGILYDEDCTNDKSEQLCLVFVMFNQTIIDALFVLQPEGGFLPIVLLQPYATKVTIEKKNHFSKDELERLNKLYQQMLGPAVEIYQKDKFERDLAIQSFRVSDQVLLEISDYSSRISIPKSETAIHYVQLCKTLTAERRFFFVELEKISDQSEIVVGIASSSHRLNEAPGMDLDTVGYNSATGHLLSNRKYIGNTLGHRCRQGDTIGIEVQTFSNEMSVVLFTKNFRPVGTRYLTLKDHQQFFPTILIDSNNDPVDLNVFWHTRVSLPPELNMKNIEDWCLPDKATIDLQDKTLMLPEHFDYSICIQAPHSLTRKNSHFEITLVDKFSDNNPPPAIAICTASPMDPPPVSQFKQDYLRFWGTGDAAKYLKQGDKIGWGILFPSVEQEDQLLICYLTVNRAVNYYRVLHQVIGGFYPVIIAPPNVNRIKMEYSSTQTPTEDFTTDQIQSILADARYQIEEEEIAMLNSDTPLEEINQQMFADQDLTFSNHVYQQQEAPVTQSQYKNDYQLGIPATQPRYRNDNQLRTSAAHARYRNNNDQSIEAQNQSAACIIL